MLLILASLSLAIIEGVIFFNLFSKIKNPRNSRPPSKDSLSTSSLTEIFFLSCVVAQAITLKPL